MGDNRWLRNSAVYLIILVAAVALLVQYGLNTKSPDSLTFSAVVDMAMENKITKIVEHEGSSLIDVTQVNSARPVAVRKSTNELDGAVSARGARPPRPRCGRPWRPRAHD